jgi:hypothetical protein
VEIRERPIAPLHVVSGNAGLVEARIATAEGEVVLQR